jgi:hypothetical protein
MKNKIFALVSLCLVVCIAFATNQAGQHDEDGTKLNLWIPGFLVKIVGSTVADYEDEDLGEFLTKFGSVTICIREGSKYTERTDKKLTRKINRLDKKNYEPLLKVHDEEAVVQIRLKENKKGIIKRVVILADEKYEAYVYLNIHCRLNYSDIDMLSKAVSEMDS